MMQFLRIILIIYNLTENKIQVLCVVTVKWIKRLCRQHLTDQFGVIFVQLPFQEDEKFLPSLFAQLMDDETDDGHRRDLVLFLKEFCTFSQTLQPQNRESFFKVLFVLEFPFECICMFVHNYIIFHMSEELLSFYRNTYIILSLINFNRTLEKYILLKLMWYFETWVKSIVFKC